MRKFLKFIACCLLFSILFAGSVSATEASLPTTSARAAILMDQYGQVLYAQNADASLPMASTTKIMTALVALEIGDPEARVKIPPTAVGVEGSSAYLMAGEEMTLLTLLYALMLESANDAATAIAILLAGSVEAFADLMNQKAESLGLTATHFTNPHGLDDEAHYTSAHDLATLTLAALKNETFARIVSTVRYAVPVEGSDRSRLFVNHNRLLKEYDGCIGVKTGFTKRTGRCLVSAARRDGITLIAVTLGDPDDWRDHQTLLDYGFFRCNAVNLTGEGISWEIPVVGGVSNTLTCESREEITISLPQGSQPKMVVELPHFVFAGVQQGKQLGRAVWYLAGKQVAEVPLYASEDAMALTYEKSFFQKIGAWFASVWKWLKELF